MPVAECACGGALEVGDDALGQALACPYCGRTLRAIANIADNEPFTARLTIATGPDRVGEQLLLGGDQPIGVGKLTTTAIRFASPLVSRLHCELRPTPAGGWTIADRNSANGLFVNQMHISSRTLQSGDVIRVGEYELRFEQLVNPAPLVEAGDGPDDLYDVDGTRRTAPSIATVPPPQCPRCHRNQPFGAKICVDCGIDLESGEPLAVSSELDEEELAARAEAWITPVSRILPAGMFPITFKPVGACKPYATWAIAIVTVLASAMFYAYLAGNANPEVAALNLQLWTGSRQVTDDKAVHLRRTLERHYRDEATTRATDGRLGAEAARRAALLARVEAADMLGAPDGVGFRWHQPLTHALLHDGILSLALNLLFLLVFGLRVNELIGNARLLILYPLLAAGPALVDRLSHAHDALAPAQGASAAVMGLAGMYLVFFPVQRVHAALWIRVGSWLRYQLIPLRGFVLVALWIGINDLLPMFFKSEDQIAHGAHLAAFALGAVAAIALLLTRQVNACGSDILSVALGRRAQTLLGKPRAAAAGGDALPV